MSKQTSVPEHHTWDVIDRAHDLAEFCATSYDLKWARLIIDQEVRRREFKADGFVYVLRAGAYYKIGRARHADSRIRQLKIQLPFPVEVVCVIPCEDYAASEAWLHWLHSGERVNGEWFVLDDFGLSSLKRYAERGMVYRKGDDHPTVVRTEAAEARR